MSFHVEDERIEGEDIGPPGKAIKPTVEGFDLLEMEGPGDNKNNDPDHSMNAGKLFIESERPISTFSLEERVEDWAVTP
jgi:hypothetical protein